MSDWVDVSDESPRAAYTATASQTVFAVPFVFFSNSDLVVYQNGNALVLDTNYTVTGAEDEDGGTVTLVTGATVSDAIQIVRVVPYEQTTHIPPSGPLDVPAINIQFSKFVAMIQQIADTVTRSFRLADNVTLDGGIEGSPAPVAGEYLKWNATGDGIESTSIITPDGTYALATKSEAEAGAIHTVLMTPLRTKEAITAQVGSTGVGQFGVVGDGVTDVTAELNTAIAAGNVTIPAGNYIVTGDITIPSNRFIWIQKGANFDIDGGRITAYLPGGGNVHIRNDGVLYFHDTDTGALVGDWRSNVLYPERGMIEMGGTQASPAGHFSVTGTGRVYSDYSFTNLASTGITDLTFQLNRKGIAFFNCHDVLVEGQEVDHIYGEAIYHLSLSAASSYNVIFTKNNVHHCAFNGLNFNSLVAFEHFHISNNRIENCFTGIELSTGHALNNRISTVQNGIVTGGGGGLFGLRIIDNHVYSTTGIGIDVEFDAGGSSVEGIIVRGNTVEFAGTHAYFLSKITGFQLKDNFSYAHATVGAGLSYSITSTAVSGHLDGNCTKSPGAFSSGTFVNAGSGSTVGTNPNI